ncbi:hypothetical protein SKAU_G00083900 [Synaphobranchus kaupii]|uniref:phosphatidylinositol-3,5-bisphosphate 3-phosphatase n=1 Tax=Synaphobranchus kaupii TaxID=118154 RepID=A0A9Q1FVQ1_SYNKA|nr:hypothetical protein SKAU_G00083900 [Synaphobranchus kaupii]
MRHTVRASCSVLNCFGAKGPPSLEYIHPKDLFPQKELVKEVATLQVPFPVLQGEWVEYLGHANDAIIAMSNYRLHIKFKDSVINVPLCLIEAVDSRDMFQLHIICKDSKVVRCHFSTLKQCQDWLKRLRRATAPPARLEDLFAFAYHAWSLGGSSDGKDQHAHLCNPGDQCRQRLEKEVLRMGFDMQNAWRVSDINSNYNYPGSLLLSARLCSSYPQKLLVPLWITDKELECVASFRSGKRIPVVVYRHQRNGAVIARCSQPEISWWGWRNTEDEYLVTSIAKACLLNSGAQPPSSSPCWPQEEVHYSSSDFATEGRRTRNERNDCMQSWLAKCRQSNHSSLPFCPAPHASAAPQKLLILDARSYPAAVANRAKGGGSECEEYYPHCEVKFMGMANIHSIRNSFQSLRAVCCQIPDPSSWLSALEGTRWMQHLSVMLKAATLVCSAVEREGRPVLVHCSDGWDRTPQIVALAKILLDPYYRTLEGLQVLVESEWLDFGHKFGDRCGHQETAGDVSEQCPVFLQWLDCVHQLLKQFPCVFEFNEAFLVKLVQHTYSCLYGTFLCNSAGEREARNIHKRTCPIWSLLRHGNKNFNNFLYISNNDMVLQPVCHTRALHLWTAVYLPSSSPCAASDDPIGLCQGEELAFRSLDRLPKTRSMENLVSACQNGVPLNRTSSDPNLKKLCQEAGRLEPESKCKGAENGELAPPRLPWGEEPSEEKCGPLWKDCMTTQPLPSSHPTCLGPIPQRAEASGYCPFKPPSSEEGQQSKILNSDTSPSPSLHTPSLATHNGHLPNGVEGIIAPTAEVILSGKNPPDTSLPGDSSRMPAEQRAEPSVGGDGESQTEGEGEAEGEMEGGSRRRGNMDILGSAGPNNSSTAPSSHPKNAQGMVKPSGEQAAWLCQAPQTHGQGTEPSRGQCCHRKKPCPARGLVHSGSLSTVKTFHTAPWESPNSHAGPPLSTQPPPQATPPAYLDEDGLPEVEALRRQVRQLQVRLESRQYCTPPSEPDLDYEDDFTCLRDSDDSEKEGSVSDPCEDSVSEGSWAQVEQRDTEVTRWVPDHMVSQCFSCDCEFWIAKRRHHCRNCGNVFCKDCCHLKLPIPEQQLYEPVLVCNSCHDLLLDSRTCDIRSHQLKKPIAAASS